VSRVVIFTGPTLSAAEGQTHLDADYRAPAAQGDVYAAARERPWAIGIIDGLFERVPAVWHKEILWAMSHGVRVYGSASMGALRAAELHTFGMRGVGEVFRMLADGTLEDDDEVTLVHGPAETGFRAASTAMVDIRATFDAAARADVISTLVRDQLIRIAKAMFYPRRSYEAILAAARSDTAEPGAIDALEAWLPAGRVHLKRRDALAMLDRIGDDARTETDPFHVQFRFQHTDAWEQVRRQIDLRPAAGGDTGRTHDAILDELRLRPDMHREVRRDALADALSLELADRDRWTVSDSALRNALHDLRIRHRLAEPEAVDAWLDAQGLDTDRFATLFEEFALAWQVQEVHGQGLDGRVVDRLRLTGTYADLADRARRKQAALAERRIDNPTLASAGLDEASLWLWYFDQRLGCEPPADLALAARDAGFLDLHDMRRAVLREYIFVRGTEARGTERARPHTTQPP
jgi:hypothetical protein